MIIKTNLRLIILLLFSLVFISCGTKGQKQFQSFLNYNSNTEWMQDAVQLDLSDYKKKNLSLNDLSCSDKSQSMFILIHDNEVFYNTYSEDLNTSTEKGKLNSSRVGVVLNVLKTISQSKTLPNTAFCLRYSDGLKDKEETIPFFGFSKLRNSQGILIPDSLQLGNSSNNSHHVGDMMFVLDDVMTLVAWSKKENKAFFRGATTGGEGGTDLWTKKNYLEKLRTKVVLLSQKNPNYIDAAFTTYVQFQDENFLNEFKKMFPVKKWADPSDWVRYKYLLDVDGNTSGWVRQRLLLASNSVMFKHNSKYIQWYSSLLKDGTNYIEVKNNFSDLLDKIIWATQNDSICKEISENATKLALNAFTVHATYEYFYKAIVEYENKFNVGKSITSDSRSDLKIAKFNNNEWVGRY